MYTCTYLYKRDTIICFCVNVCDRPIRKGGWWCWVDVTIVIFVCARARTMFAETADQISAGQIRRRRLGREPDGVRLARAHRVRGTSAGRRRRPTLLDRRYFVPGLSEEAVGRRRRERLAPRRAQVAETMVRVRSADEDPVVLSPQVRRHRHRRPRGGEEAASTGVDPFSGMFESRSRYVTLGLQPRCTS